MNEVPWVLEDDLQAQYHVLKNRGIFNDYEIAIHLARFAEARARVDARRIIERLEDELCKLRSPEPYSESSGANRRRKSRRR